MKKTPKAVQKGRLCSKIIFNTVIPRPGVVSPAQLGIGDPASPEGIPLGKRGMTHFLNCYACNSVMITIELRFRSLFWLYECSVSFIILTFKTSTHTSIVSHTLNFDGHFSVDITVVSESNLFIAIHQSYQ